MGGSGPDGTPAGDAAALYTTLGYLIYPFVAMAQACPQPDCNKKVVDQGNNTFRCEKCAKEYPDFKWRMLLQVRCCLVSSSAFDS